MIQELNLLAENRLESAIHNATIIGDAGESYTRIPKLFEIENVETPEYVTVSINEEFIPGDQKETYQLKDGDNVEFLYFMGGGQR